MDPRTVCGLPVSIVFRRIKTAPARLAATLAPLVVVAALVAPARAAGECAPGVDWGTNRPDLAAQVVQLVNEYRASKGLGQLAVSSPLTASSTWKSLHMARYGYFSHDDQAPPVARTAYARAGDCGFAGSAWGENIAYGYGSAEAVMSGWIGSSGHRANLENASFTTIGVGVASNAGGTLYWTQNFGNDASPPASPPPPSSPPPSTPPPSTPAPAPPPTSSPAPPAPSPATPSGPSSTAPAQPSAATTGSLAAPAPDPTPAQASAAAPAATLGALPARTRTTRGGTAIVASVGFIDLETGLRVTAGDVRCRAEIAGTRLKVLTSTFRAGSAVCEWRIPARLAGKPLTGTVALQAENAAIRRLFVRASR